MSIKNYTENEKKYFEVYVNGFDSRGKRIQKRRCGIESAQKARAVEFELKRELAQAREEAVPHRWHEWFDECMRRMKIEMRPSTIYNYEKMVRKWVHPHWQERELQTITRYDVHQLIFETSASIVTANSRKTLLKMIKRLFAMAVENGSLDRNPCLGIQVRAPEVEQKVLTTSEAETFLREARLAQHRFYPIWALALMTGMRSGELFALRWSDIDLDSRIIRVCRQWTSTGGIGPTKTQRSRVVPISDDLEPFLKELRLKRGSEESVLPQLVEWERGEQARVTKDFCLAIGLTPIKFHDLRATFITNLLARGVSLARVMSMVGHTQLKTTNGYLRKAGVDVQGATESLGYKLPQVIEGNVFNFRAKK